MRLLLKQLEQSLTVGHYYLSLFTALSLPDIAGAIGSQNGKANGKKYKCWYNEWARPRFGDVLVATRPWLAGPDMESRLGELDGENCYRFRCSLLHQGTTMHVESQYSRIIFIEPGATTNSVHYCILNGALCIDLEIFCREIILGMNMWLDKVESTDRYQQNYGRFARRHPTGFKPYIVGVPVIG